MHEWDSFGEAFPLQMLSLTPETKVPGVLIFSPEPCLWLAGCRDWVSLPQI